MPGHRRCRGHRGADQVGAAAVALPALEVAVAGGRAALAGLQPVGVHRQAHRAARLPPFEAGGFEDHVQAFALGLAACNTIEGAGKDVKAAGQGIEKAAEKSKPY